MLIFQYRFELCCAALYLQLLASMYGALYTHIHARVCNLAPDTILHLKQIRSQCSPSLKPLHTLILARRQRRKDACEKNSISTFWGEEKFTHIEMLKTLFHSSILANKRLHPGLSLFVRVIKRGIQPKALQQRGAWLPTLNRWKDASIYQ